MSAVEQSSAAFQDEIPNFLAYEPRVLSLPRVGNRVRVSQPQSRWVVELKDRFDELTALPRGWDGYAGCPVSFNCAQFAANLIERLFVSSLPAPQLVPGGDGTLQIEWHRGQFDIEIDVLAPYEVVATRHDLESGASEEIELQSDFNPLGVWLSELESRCNKDQFAEAV